MTIQKRNSVATTPTTPSWKIMGLFQEFVSSCNKDIASGNYSAARSSLTDDYAAAYDTQFSHFHHG